MVAWVVWAGVFVLLLLLFVWLWRFAARIEQQERLEHQWQEYLSQLEKVDPVQAQQMRQYFEIQVMR